MFYDAIENQHGLSFDPFKALVVPRPIGWVSTLNEDGVANLAPYSFFNAVAHDPGIVMFSSYTRKDSQTNAETSGEFVCNLASWDLRDQMNASSAPVEAGVDEFELAGLEKAECEIVRPPRVKAALASFECKYLQTVDDLPDGKGGIHVYNVVFGLVVGIHINDQVIVDGKVDITLVRPIARLGYKDYAVVNETFSMTRPG